MLAISAVILILLALVQVGSDSLSNVLEYRRQEIANGQLWRLYTGHFTHFGDYHALMNAAGFAALVGVLFWYLPNVTLLVGVLVIPLFVGLGLHMFAEDVDIYRGFSGANYGLLAMGLLMALPQQRWLYGFAFLVLLGKIAFEQMPGYDVNYLQDEMGVAVAIEAHLAGFCGGSVLGMAGLLKDRFNGKNI